MAEALLFCLGMLVGAVALWLRVRERANTHWERFWYAYWRAQSRRAVDFEEKHGNGTRS